MAFHFGSLFVQCVYLFGLFLCCYCCCCCGYSIVVFWSNAVALYYMVHRHTCAIHSFASCMRLSRTLFFFLVAVFCSPFFPLTCSMLVLKQEEDQNTMSEWCSNNNKCQKIARSNTPSNKHT